MEAPANTLDLAKKNCASVPACLPALRHATRPGVPSCEMKLKLSPLSAAFTKVVRLAWNSGNPKHKTAEELLNMFNVFVKWC